jgi:hypothetical protein
MEHYTETKMLNADALDRGRSMIDLELRRYRRRLKELVDTAVAREHGRLYARGGDVRRRRGR